MPSRLLALALFTVLPLRAAAWTGPVTVQVCRAPALSLPAQTETALDATLLVVRGEVSGSGVVVSPDGFALTAAHVVGRDERVEVVTHQGIRLQAEVIRVHQEADVALLKVAASGMPCLPLWRERRPVGSDVFVLGSPGGEVLAFSVSKGIVSSYRDVHGRRVLQTDASVNPGNSGGPLVDDAGRVVGLASFKIVAVGLEGLSFAVPTHEAIGALELAPGTVSTQQLAEVKGRRDLQPAPPPVHTAAPLQRARPWPAGLVLLASGGLAIGGTWAVYQSAPDVDEGEWYGLIALNSLGWVAAAGGLTLLAVSIDDQPGVRVGFRW